MLAAYDGDAIVDWSWVGDHIHEILLSIEQHMELVGWSLFWGLVFALPLAVLAHRFRLLRGPTLSVMGILYTVPSLAAFALLLPYTGLDQSTAIIPLATYTLLILVRNIITGLDGVAPDVEEAALGMGYSSTRRVLRIELPLAVPEIIAGVRIAAVTLIGLVPVAALVGQGGLGTMMLDGLNRAFQTPLTVSLVLVVLLAVAADLALVGVQRLVAPWERKQAKA